MSGGRIHRGVYIECDGAGCHEFLEGTSYHSVWNSPEAEGWKSRKICGEWFNYCPDHNPDNAKPDLSNIMNRKF